MEISFATERLQNTFESKKTLRRAHGDQCAKKVMARLVDLAAVSSMEAARHLPGRYHELKGDRAGQFGVDLADGKRLILEPTEDPPPTKSDGGLDWAQIDAICVLEVVDYHG